NGPELEHYPVDPDYNFSFDFDNPEVVKLPKKLKEISGLTGWKADGQLLAVQDEDGLFFVVDAASGDIVESFKFGKDRDYEGITRNEDTIYVLERDGDLHVIDYVPGQKEYQATKVETDFSYRNDTEGLVYEAYTNSLLIAPKENELSPNLGKYQRGIYRYHIASGITDPEPAYILDLMAIGKIIYGKQKPHLLKPSGVAIDPLTGDVYVIASVGGILVVLSQDGELKHIEILREKVFTQPEGICFDDSGNLYLSSEGRGGKGIVARLPRRPITGTNLKDNE
ncbi:MAG: SdiA-regulated domain-containing protein, partial [Bacteroidota bacterium]